MRCSLRLLLTCVIVSASAAPPLAAQGAGEEQAITAEDIAHHIGVIADDSMRGRDTPSRGLELTAQYVADQFARAGLMSAADFAAQHQGSGILGEDGPNGRSPWFQRYPLPLPVDFARSSVVFAANGQRVAAGWTTAAYLGRLRIPREPANEGVLLITGASVQDPLFATLERADLDRKTLLYVQPHGAEAGSRAVKNWLDGRGTAVVVLADQDSAEFADRLQVVFHQPIYGFSGSWWTTSVRAAAVPGLAGLFATLDIDLPRLFADTVPAIRALPSLQLSLDAQMNGTTGDTATTAPNVVGVLEGSDPKLKDEYVIISAHMDHVGVGHGQADSGCGGRADNAAGTAGLIALAKAFGQPGARPRRSVIFVATSGGAKPGFWGGAAFVAGIAEVYGVNLNLAAVECVTPDSVTVDGLGAFDANTPPAWIAAAHPELRLTIVPGESVFDPQADYFAFTAGSLNLPSLSFRIGVRQDGRQKPGDAAATNAEQVARVTRLVYFVAQAMANADRHPQWNAESRRQLFNLHLR